MEVKRVDLAKWALRTSPKLNVMKYKGTYLYYNYVHLVCEHDFLFTYCIFDHIFLDCNLNVVSQETISDTNSSVA